jgi:hypothetical protein
VTSFGERHRCSIADVSQRWAADRRTQGDNVKELRDRYFRTLGFDPIQASAKHQLVAALTRAYQQRSFEIEHYWKRATYFWGFQIAIFAAFGLLWRASSIVEWGALTVALPGLGLLTAVANSITARGSKFWQNNWEHHIDMLEDTVEGRLYKTVWLREGTVSFSVSRVNATLSDCFVVFWLLVTAYVSWHFLGAPLPNWLPHDVLRAGYVFVTTLLVVIGLVSLVRQRTRLPGTLPTSDGSHGKSPWAAPHSWRARAGTKPSTFVRRYAPDEHQ